MIFISKLGKVVLPTVLVALMVLGFGQPILVSADSIDQSNDVTRAFAGNTYSFGQSFIPTGNGYYLSQKGVPIFTG